MLLPKRTKFRRQHRGRFKGVSKANTIVFGEYGLQGVCPQSDHVDPHSVVRDTKI